MEWIKKENGLPKAKRTDNFLCVCKNANLCGYDDNIIISVRTFPWMKSTYERDINTWTHYMPLPNLPSQ